jgi:hypothetical protein
MDWKDILTRAGWTAAECFAALAASAFAVFASSHDIDVLAWTLGSAVVAALAAGISIVKTAIVQKRDAWKAGE